MSEGFNNNSYKVLVPINFYDIFNKQECPLVPGAIVGSAVVNQLIVGAIGSGIDNGQPYIDKMVELGYVEVVI